MTNSTLNIKPFNIAMTGDEVSTETQIVWVAITDGLSSASMVWYYDQKFALTLFENDKERIPENMQALLFPFEVSAELDSDQITEVIDEFYADFGYDINFLANENVLSSPYSPEEWAAKARIYDNKNFLNPKGDQQNHLFFVHFNTIDDVGLVLNNQLLAYSDYQDEEFTRLMNSLEKALNIKALGAELFMPKNDEWQDWNWDLVMAVMTEPDLRGLVLLHSLEK